MAQAFLLDLLHSQLGQVAAQRERALDVVDIGGGTGGVATSLASLGHRVTVVDPSPDALASLERRTAETGQAGQIRGVQGDAADLAALIGPGVADVVVCHRVLEFVDSPLTALHEMAAVLAPGGVLSLLVQQRQAMVLSAALAGRLTLARELYADPLRFDHDSVLELVTRAGFSVVASHGIGAVAEHVPESVVEGSAENYASLAALEAVISQDPAFRALAPVVHVFAEIGPRPK